jgi:hypothetical protein
MRFSADGGETPRLQESITPLPPAVDAAVAS